MCSKVLNTVCTNNASYHLRREHKLVENCPEHIKKVEEANLARLQQMRTPQVMEAFDKRDMLDQRLDYVVWFAIPVSRCEDPRFRVAHPELPKCRTTFREKIVAHCVKRHDAALAKFVGRRCTLAFDSGTIWNKYMCVVLCSGRLPPLVYEVAECHSATAVWTKDLLQRVIIELKAKKIFPLGLVADNASNVQAAAADIEVSSNLLSQRCMAHSLQLAIDDCFKAGERIAQVWHRIDTVIRANPEEARLPCETRWNSKYDCLVKMLSNQKIKYTASSDGFIELGQALRVWSEATDALQSDSSMMVDACAWITSLCVAEPESPMASDLHQAWNVERLTS